MSDTEIRLEVQFENDYFFSSCGFLYFLYVQFELLSAGSKAEMYFTFFVPGGVVLNYTGCLNLKCFAS